jgi:HD-GYP domain-containing protein (c-di-GMP phosphodiesterase class II)
MVCNRAAAFKLTPLRADSLGHAGRKPRAANIAAAVVGSNQAMSVTVKIEELKVGMFVHLDLGWWAHPFALSSFIVTSPDQIDTIRSLGLKQLRWSPEKSRLDDTASDGTPAPAFGSDPADGTADGADSAAPADAANDGADALPPTTVVETGTAGPAGVHGATPLHPRSPLTSQRAAQQLCEQQYLEAGTAWHEAQRQLPRDPAQAKSITEGLTRALLDKLMVDREMCVRVLSDVGGDRISGHALNVTVISLLMARVFGFGEQDLLDMGMGALLHDVGKIDLPDRVQHGDSHLGPADMRLYREHVAHGVAHGQRMGLSEGALAVLAQHHEMADGSGFPGRLNVDKMSTAARIVSLVNRYDNLCNPPQAAQSLTPHEALSLIFAQSRTKFDATMLNAFIRMMGVYPPGSVVQLTDDRYASVVSVNSSRPLKPRVLVCDTRVPVDEALLLNLDGQADLGIRRSLKPGQLPAAVRDYLSPRPRMVYFFEPVCVDAADAQQALAA